MALDRQKILSELGSVVNQLQSADCGCMGKMFADPGQSNYNNVNNSMPSYGGYGHCHGHGCHHSCHGSPAPCAGEPYPRTGHCMGQFCNPPKLYSETYNYLNHNLMKPVVKEVYDDLKSITPTNTFMNSPMAGQMGLSPAEGAPQGTMGSEINSNMDQNQNPGNMQGYMPATGQMPNTGMGNTDMSMQVNAGGQQGMQQKMMGMGPQIMNMMMGDGGAKGMAKTGGQLPGSGNASEAQYGQPGGAPVNMTGDAANQGYYDSGATPENQGSYYNTANPNGMSNVGQMPNQPMTNQTTAQYMSQPNTYSGFNNPMGGNAPQTANTTTENIGNTYGGVPQQKMAASHGQGRYGQHGAGIAKFNEMFPGVMGGDLGFDPMAIAIQMNPANLKQAAMKTMQDMMMNNNKAGIDRANRMQPPNNIGDGNGMQNQIQQNPQQNASAYQTNPASQVPTNAGATPVQSYHGNASLAPAQSYHANAGLAPTQSYHSNAGVVSPQTHQIPQQQQQVYTALTGAPSMQQQEVPQQQYQQPESGEAQPLPTVYEGSVDPNAYARQQPTAYNSQPQQMIKEPIFPAEGASHPSNFNNQKYIEYNTLGQPIESLPASIYQTPVPNLPQTLSPQSVPTDRNTMKYSNVKSTISKTSLMGNKPVGRVPSRNQLQHIYNQYKGSQSFTQQSIKGNERFSHSEGNLNVAQNNPPRQIAIEKVGGDNIVQANPTPTKHGDAMDNSAKVGRMGDVPADYKPPDAVKEAQPTNLGNYRNGLQDMKFTSYPTSTSWTFHGNNQAPFSTGYQFRAR